MDKATFDRLPAEQRLKIIKRRLDLAGSATEVFGADADAAKARYKRLMQDVHPDRHPDHIDLASAVSAQANVVSESGPWIAEVVAGIATTSNLGSGDIANVCRGVDDNGAPFVVKVVRDAAENDLMANEMKVLMFLATQPGFDEAARYLPMPHAYAVVGARQVNLLRYHADYLPDPARLIPLSEVVLYYADGLPDRHIGWIWRRLLALFTFIHHYGVIHAAITPDNILIDPENHGLVLIDWVHASASQSMIRTLSADWIDHYPPEVRNRELPLPTVDSYMAAKAMQWAQPNAAEPIQRYFEWCTASNRRLRPDQSQLLFDEWDRVMYEHLGWKREFVPMDVGFSWQWWS